MIRTLFSLGVCQVALYVLTGSVASAADSPAPGRDTVVANVDGQRLTLGEFEDQQAGNLFAARNAYYQAERKSLEDYVDDVLLSRQAQKENLTVEQLLDRHVRSTLPKDPSDEALHVYYEGIDPKESFEALRGRILDHIRQMRYEKAKAAYLQTLRTKSNIAILLPPPRAEVAVNNTPLLGAHNAPVTVVEFADYECPYCQQVAPQLRKLAQEYQGKIAFAYKDNPLPMHPHAQKAAEAAHCAAAQGKYWEYHDALYETKKLDLADLKNTARTLHLDSAAFDSCLDSGAQAAAVKAQADEGQKLNVTGTPTFYINGRLLSGVPSYDTLRNVINEELQASQLKQTASR